jgi:hypothetical protein
MKVGLIAAGVTAVVVLALMLQLRRTLTDTRERLEAHFDHSRPQLLTMLNETVTEQTENAFAVFTRILEPSREDLVGQEDRSREQMGRLFALRESLQKLAQELQGSAASA